MQPLAGCAATGFAYQALVFIGGFAMLAGQATGGDIPWIR